MEQSSRFLLTAQSAERKMASYTIQLLNSGITQVCTCKWRFSIVLFKHILTYNISLLRAYKALSGQSGHVKPRSATVTSEKARERTCTRQTRLKNVQKKNTKKPLANKDSKRQPPKTKNQTKKRHSMRKCSVHSQLSVHAKSTLATGEQVCKTKENCKVQRLCIKKAENTNQRKWNWTKVKKTTILVRLVVSISSWRKIIRFKL